MANDTTGWDILKFCFPSSSIELPEDRKNATNIFRLLIKHRLIGLASQDLLKHEEFEPYKEQYRKQLQVAIALHAELQQIVSLLDSNRVIVSPYKGSILSQYLYNNPYLRLHCDNDLIVKTEQFYTLHDILIANDYCAKYPKAHLSKLSSIKTAGGIPYINRKNGLTIEIHASIAERKFCERLDNQKYFENCLQYHYRQKYLFPKNEYLFLCLAIHGCKHNWTSLIWLFDVFTLLHNSTGLLERTALLAKKYNLQNYIYYTAQILKNNFNNNLLSTDTLDFARLAPVKIIKAGKKLSVNYSYEKSKITFLCKLSTQLQLQSGLRTKAVFLLRTIFDPAPQDLNCFLSYLRTPYKKLIRNPKTSKVKDLYLNFKLLFQNTFWQIYWSIKLYLSQKFSIAKYMKTQHSYKDPKLLLNIIKTSYQAQRLIPWKITCLARALATWQVLNTYNYPAVVKIEANKNDKEFNAHAWIAVQDREYYRNKEDLNYVTLTSEITTENKQEICTN